MLRTEIMLTLNWSHSALDIIIQRVNFLWKNNKLMNYWELYKILTWNYFVYAIICVPILQCESIKTQHFSIVQYLKFREYMYMYATWFGRVTLPNYFDTIFVGYYSNDDVIGAVIVMKSKLLCANCWNILILKERNKWHKLTRLNEFQVFSI